MSRSPLATMRSFGVAARGSHGFAWLLPYTTCWSGGESSWRASRRPDRGKEWPAFTILDAKATASRQSQKAHQPTIRMTAQVNTKVLTDLVRDRVQASIRVKQVMLSDAAFHATAVQAAMQIVKALRAG